jgi:putative YhbY family RNA-binding protein
MTQLSAAERKALKARAHPIKPIVMIGDAGLSPGVMTEIERGLTSHELIKIRVAMDDREGREALLAEICKACGASAVQHIGKILVIWRKSAEKIEQKPAKRPARSKPRTDPRVRPAKASRAAKTPDDVSDPRRRGRVFEQSERPSTRKSKTAAAPRGPRPVRQNTRRQRSVR